MQAVVIQDAAIPADELRPSVQPVAPVPPPGEPAVDRENAGRRSRRGVEYDSGKRWIAYSLGACLAAIAVFNLGPTIYQIVELSRADRPIEWRGWMLAAVFVSGIQLAYAIYLVQLPDYSSIWIVALIAMLTATLYAAALAIIIWAPDDHWLLAFLEFDLQLRRTVAMWCVGMLGCYGLLAYYCGPSPQRRSGFHDAKRA